MAPFRSNLDSRAPGGWRRPLRLLPLLVSLACLTSCSTGAAASPISEAAAISAMNAFSLEQLPAQSRDPQLAAMQAEGVEVVRSDAPWADIEPQPPGPAGHLWRFAQTDAWVAQLATHHLTWEPLIDYAVGWAKSCAGFCPPARDAPYAAFAQAVAARYGAAGTFWAQNPGLPYLPAHVFEIWNEENVAAFSVPAARYVTLYVAARRAIQAVDPQASVVVGGLADDSGSFDAGRDYPAWFIEQMFQADPGLEGSLDGVALHPYGATATDVEQWIAHFRSVLAQYGEGSIPIDVTEVGWTTGDAIRESWRAGMMSRLGADLVRSNCGIRLLAPYTWINPSVLGENGDFGFVDRSGSDTALRPAGAAWFSGLTLGGSQPQLALCPAADASTSSSAPAAPLGSLAQPPAPLGSLAQPPATSGSPAPQAGRRTGRPAPPSARHRRPPAKAHPHRRRRSSSRSQTRRHRTTSR